MCDTSELQACQPVFTGFISSLSTVHFSRKNINWCQRSSSSSVEDHGLRVMWLHNSLSLRCKISLPTWLGYWKTELVCWGYYNQRPLSGWLKGQFIFSQFCSLEVQGQYVNGSGFFWGLSLAWRWLLSHCILLARGLFSVHLQVWCPDFFLLERHQLYRIRAYMKDLTLIKLLLKTLYSHIPGYWRLGLQHVNLGGREVGHRIQPITKTKWQSKTLIKRSFFPF